MPQHRSPSLSCAFVAEENARLRHSIQIVPAITSAAVPGQRRTPRPIVLAKTTAPSKRIPGYSETAIAEVEAPTRRFVRYASPLPGQRSLPVDHTAGAESARPGAAAGTG